MSDLKRTARDQMTNGIRNWMTGLESYPGWREWRRGRIAYTLYFDDPFPISRDERPSEFKFADPVEKEHAVVIQYLGLEECVNSLKECEYYFRRYPFRNTPVTRYNHISNVCEMYFGRFYQFKERLRNYFDAVQAAAPTHNLDVGQFIKLFNKEFDAEMRARNSAQHHQRFEDVAIDRIFLTGSIDATREDRGWRQEHLKAYRKSANEWAQRVRRRAARMEEFLEAVAGATLNVCPFLSKDQPPESEDR
jgi:hypothetical protein